MDGWLPHRTIRSWAYKFDARPYKSVSGATARASPSERLPIDYTAASLSRLENGKLAYTQEVVEALARAFQCAPYELFHTPQDAELWRKFNALLPRQRSAALVLIEVAFSQHNSPT